MINPEISVASKSLSTVYENAAHYPNIVFDDFVDSTLIKAVANEAKWLTENIETEGWRFGNPDFHNHQVLKRGITEIEKMTPAMAIACTYFNNQDFINFLKDLTGIDDLV